MSDNIRGGGKGAHMVKVVKQKSRFILAVQCLLSLAVVALGVSTRLMLEEQALDQELLLKGLLYTSILSFALFLNDVYQVQVMANRRRLLNRLFKASAVAVGVYALSSALVPDQTQGRVVFGASLLLLNLGVLLLHTLLKPILLGPSFLERVLVIGDGKLADAVRMELTSADYHQRLLNDVTLERQAYGLIGALGRNESAAAAQHEHFFSQVDLLVLAQDELEWGLNPSAHRESAESETRTVVSLQAHRRKKALSQPPTLEPTLSQEPLDRETLLRGLVALKLSGQPIMRGMDYYEQLTGRVYVGTPNDPLFFSYEHFRIDRLSFLVKAVYEWGVALTMFILALPFLALVPVAIWLEDRKSPLFVQLRVGRNGRIYKLYKWRSMNEQGQITRVGHFIRKTKLDELPQLINVLRGEMSLVGPRPEMPHFVQEFEQKSPYYSLRHMVRPGLTGWAQIMFPDAKAHDAMIKLGLDLYYVKHFSLSSDMVIMAETLKMILFGGIARTIRNGVPQETVSLRLTPSTVQGPVTDKSFQNGTHH